MLDIDKRNFNGYENVFIKFAKINFITVTKHPNLKQRQLPIHTSFQIVGGWFFFSSFIQNEIFYESGGRHLKTPKSL